MDDESRSDITRTLVTLLTAKYGLRPGKNHCKDLARQLILKYPFMIDDMGSGYVRHLLLCVHDNFSVISSGIMGIQNAGMH